MPVADDVGGWVSSLAPTAIPEVVSHHARLCILDSLGTALAASSVSLGEPAIGVAARSDGRGTCSVVGTRMRVDPGTAALANGWLVNALDWDDTYLPAIIHPTCNVLPAAMAVAEERDLAMSELVTAVVAGSEVTLGLAVALRNEAFRRNYSTSGTLGPFGAAAAAARSLGLDGGHVADALGIVGTLVGGVMQSIAEGCSVKGLGPGHSAAQGVLATQLAAGGVAGPREILEGRLGLAATYFPGCDTDLDGLGLGLGTDWRLPGVTFKRHPGAHRAHPYVASVLAVARAAGVEASQVARIICVCSPQLDYFNLDAQGYRPPNRYLARFSLAYLVGVSLLHGGLDESDFDDAHRTDERVLEMVSRVDVRVDDARDEADLLGEVEVELRDGSVLRSTALTPDAPASAEDLVVTKFRRNARPVVGPDVADLAATAVLETDDLPIRSLLQRLSP